MRISRMVVGTMLGFGFAAGTAYPQDTAVTTPKFTVNTLNDKPVGLSIQGATALQGGQNTQFTALLTQPDNSVLDVTEAAAWGLKGAAPSRSSIIKGKFVPGRASDLASFNISAAYESDWGLCRGETACILRDFRADISNRVEWLGGVTYRVVVDAAVTGALTGPSAEPVVYEWDLDNDGQYDDATGPSAQWMTSSLGGTSYVAVRILQNGAQNISGASIRIDKPLAANEPGYVGLRADVSSSGLKDSTGAAFAGDPAKREVGLIVITHGIWTTDDWYIQMAAEIEQRLVELGKPVPNIACYDWGGDSHGLSQVLKEHPHNVGPVATGHGKVLAEKLLQMMPSQVNGSKPIHLIGHSAGGFIMGQCALELKRQGVIVDRVTMLDTPAVFPEYLRNSQGQQTSLPNPGKVERMVTSAVGKYLGGVREVSPDGVFYRRKEISSGQSYVMYPAPGAPGGIYLSSATDPLLNLVEDHSEAHHWYRRSVEGTESQGFQNSPFMNAASVVPHSLAAPRLATLSKKSPSPTLLATTVGLTNFSFFGQVTKTDGVYRCQEVVNAGLYGPLDIPMDVDGMRFQYRFSGTNDGDYLTVRLGEGADLFYGLDLSFMGTNFTEGVVPLGIYAGLSTQVVFTLVSRGETGSVVELKDIALLTSDDADGDGLTTGQETTAGSHPQLWDTDFDGIGDLEEVQDFHTNPAEQDSDGDGLNDQQELWAGTDPTLESSCFRFVAATPVPGGSLALSWASQTGKSYRVLASTNADFSTYEIMARGLAGATAQIVYTNLPASGSDRQVFYGVGTE